MAGLGSPARGTTTATTLVVSCLSKKELRIVESNGIRMALCPAQNGPPHSGTNHFQEHPGVPKRVQYISLGGLVSCLVIIGVWIAPIWSV